MTTEVFDSGGYYDAPNSRFTPLVAGYYFVYAQAYFLQTAGTNVFAQVGISKNGASPGDEEGFFYDPGTSGPFGATSALIFMNGTTDFLEVTFSSGSSGNIQNTARYTFWHAHRVGS